MKTIEYQTRNDPKSVFDLVGLLLVFLFLNSTELHAREYEQDYWSHCSKDSQMNVEATSSQPMDFSSFLNPDVIHLYADKIIADKQQNFTLDGNIQILKSTASLTGNQALYQRSKSYLQAEGDIRFELDNLLLTGESADFNLLERTGNVRQSKIWLLDKHLRGAADTIQLEKNDKVSLMTAWLTSCDEGKEDWRIRASELHLDRAANMGTAKHARIEFFNVPVFYFPYFSYPLSGRKTGFLVPHIGKSSALGTTLSAPYYLNLMPHRDATLTLDYYSKRGTQLRSEFRYLNARNGGQINYDILPDDKKTGENLQHVTYLHKGNPLEGLATSIDYSYISDDNYLRDFGGDLGVASSSFLNQKADIFYAHKLFNVSALIQSFQTIDETISPADYPYRRMPQIRFESHELDLIPYLKFRFSAEYTQFDREADENGDTGVIGNRTDLYPQFSLPVEGPAGFITPKLGLRYTQYNLENQNESSLDSETQRTLPLFSMDGGLFFERQAVKGRIHTLEPRLFYLYVPYQDQSNLIDIKNNTLQTFDSDLMHFNLSQLFSENRFSGKDLIGDANQLSLSLTSRLLDSRGKERIRATVGQLVYFKDRQVNLVRDEIDIETVSDTLFEFSSRWSKHLSTRLDLVWDNEIDDVSQGGAHISFQKDKNRLFNFTYRYEKKQIDQIEAQIVWPIHRNWKPVLYWRYSLLDQRNLENYQGIEYDSCCWAFRVVRRDYIQDLENRNITVLFELELKGLSSVGDRARKMFSEDHQL